MGIQHRIKSIMNPSGGLFYHYSAWKYGKKYWGPFISEIKDWLKEWKPSSKKLLLIGPSGGYSLDPEFLKTFEVINVIDPDGFASIIFKKKFKLPQVQWNSKDYFGLLSKDFKPTGMSKICLDYPDHAILFCNFLGQVPLLLKSHNLTVSFDEAYIQWKEELKKSLHNREWASYHDLYSMPTKSSDTLVVTDHLTEGLLAPNKNRKLINWQRLPNEKHVIEAIYET